MLSSSDRELLLRIYAMLRLRNVAITSRSELALLMRSGVPVSGLEHLIEGGYLLEKRDALMLTPMGIEECMRLRE